MQEPIEHSPAELEAAASEVDEDRFIREGVERARRVDRALFGPAASVKSCKARLRRKLGKLLTKVGRRLEH
jgi:hypothetical protein